MVQAKTVTLNVVTPGTLSTLITDTTVTNLVLTGTIDSTDMIYISKLTKLDTLDMSNVNIVNKSIIEYAFFNVNAYVVLPNNIESLNKFAIYNYGNTKLVLPSTIKNIGVDALYMMYNLKTLVSYIENPMNIDNESFVDLTFDITETCILYVPAGTKHLYEKATGWNKMKHIVEMISTDNSTTIINKDTTSTIKLNGDWSVESSESFVTFDKTSGTADSLLTIKIAENTTDSTRTAYVSIIVDDTTTLKSVKTITLTITQTGKVISVVNEVKTNKLNVYPNPCTTSFNVNVEKESTIEVYSITGSLVLKTIVNNNESVDVNSLTSGSYIVKVDNDTKVLVKK